MVRTANSVLRVAGGKSSRKGCGGSARDTSGSPPSSSADKGGSGLNPICPRETPSWQKPITNFFTTVDKPKLENNKTVQDEPGSSKHAPDSSDINMIEDNCKITNNQPSHVEAMDEECKKANVETDKDTEDKENKLNRNANDTEMREVHINKKKVRSDDDYEEVAPRKKIKLDANICRRLRKMEQ